MNRDLPPLSSELEVLLRESPRPAPPPELHGALWKRLQSTLTLPPASPPDAAPTPLAEATSALTPLAAKMGTWGVPVSLAALVAGGALGVGVGATVFAERSAPAPVELAPAPRTEAPGAEGGPEQLPTDAPPQGGPPAREERAVPPASDSARAPAVKGAQERPRAALPRERPLPSDPPKGPTPTRDVALSDERALLEIARTALVRQQPRAALAAVEEHARRFAHGQLSEEREVLWIQALVNAGQAERAREKAAAFRRAFPDSILAPAVDAALGGLR